MRTGFRRAAVPAPVRAKARNGRIDAPINGWVSNTNLTKPVPRSAYKLDNWFPTLTGIRVRGGSDLYATIGSDPVLSLFTYVSGSSRKLFAADANQIFDITSPTTDDMLDEIEWVSGDYLAWLSEDIMAWCGMTVAVGGQTGGYYSTTQFGTSGGEFLVVVNGEDDQQLYDGTSWSTINSGSSPISITNVDTDDLSAVWSYRSRLYYVQKDTKDTWYLPLDSVGGAATKFTLRGVFQKGGTALFGATWSLDAGDGQDDKWVVVSTEGEVVVYQGADPAADDWTLVGRYEMARPLGKNAWTKAGGDVLICTIEGLIPLSEVVQKDPAALYLAAVSRNIEPDWRTEAVARQSLPWNIVKWAEKSMMVVTNPLVSTNLEDQCFVANLQSGAWARFTGWDARSLAVHDGQLYFGDSSGQIFRAETTGMDNASTYTCTYVGHFETLGSPGSFKTCTLARATFKAAREFTAKLSVSVDESVNLPSPPNAATVTSGDEWDSAVWDVAQWDDTFSASIRKKWNSVAGAGTSVAPQVQITSGSTVAPDAELLTMDVMFDTGNVVV